MGESKLINLDFKLGEAKWLDFYLSLFYQQQQDNGFRKLILMKEDVSLHLRFLFVALNKENVNRLGESNVLDGTL